MSKTKTENSGKDYHRGFLVALAILIGGTILELATREKGLALPSWPMNVYAGISFAVILIFIQVYYKEDKIVKWLSRIPASISSIVLFSVLTLILGLTRQNNPDAPEWLKATGFSNVQRSYTFLFSGIYLLTTLGLVTIRRVKRLTYRNAGFLLNHLGLWIIVFSGSLGAGDLKRINIFVNEGEEVWYGFTDNQQPFELPFRLQLEDFDIEFFPPKLALVETGTMKFPENLENNLPMMEEGLEVQIGPWEIRVEDLLESAVRNDQGRYVASSDTSAFPVARVLVRNTVNNNELSGYISSGSIMRRPFFLELDDQYTLAMTQPEPREYSSRLVLTDSEGNKRQEKLIVNEPITIEGWKLYQLSYDERLGKWSKLSIIEAIRDPWLPVIYTGIFMLIAGALYLFSIGKSPKKVEE